MALVHRNYNPDIMAGATDDAFTASALTSASASAFAVGRVGATNPAFNVDSSTAVQADGLNVKGLAAGNGVELSTITSGTNSPLKIDAAGSGTITIAGTSTGAVTITPATTITGALTQTGAATFAGAIISDAVTDTTSTTTGAIQTDGGLGVAKALWVGTTADIVGRLRTTNPVFKQTITDHDTQSPTLAVAEMLGGIIIHTSVTGAGTVSLDTGTAMSTGVTGVVAGATIKWLYYNDGNQTATITATSGHTIVGGTAAVTTGKWMNVTSVNTGSNTWVSYLQTLM